MNWRRTGAMARKEALHIMRDRNSMVMALAMPVVMLLLFGYALSLDVDHIPTWIADADQSPESRDVIARIRGSRYFEIVGVSNSPTDVENNINKDKCLLGFSIPRGFARDLELGRTAEVQILLDGSDSNTAAIALGYAETLMQMHALELQAKAENLKMGQLPRQPVDGRMRVWYNGDLKSRNYIVPGLIVVIMMIIAALLTSLTIAREWENGTMEQLLSTPVRPAEMVLGKLMAYFALGVIDMTVAIAAGALIFQVPLRGNVLFLCFTGFIFLFGALTWGIFVSTLARSQLMAYQLGSLTSFLPAFMLSGFIYAIDNMPKVIQVVTYVVPARYFIIILRGIYLKGVGPQVLWGEVLFLSVYAAIVFWAAVRRMHQKLA
jgi:ABC-2 type transport system permease protein